MNAIYVTYNGVFSAQYGLKLGSFGGNDSTEERTIFDPSVSTQKAKNMKHFYILCACLSFPACKSIAAWPRAYVPRTKHA